MNEAISGIFSAIENQALYPILGWMLRVFGLLAAIVLVAKIVMALFSGRDKGAHLLGAFAAVAACLAIGFLPQIVNGALSTGGAPVEQVDTSKAEAAAGGAGNKLDNEKQEDAPEEETGGADYSEGRVIDDPTAE